MCCALCGLEVGTEKKGDNAFVDHQRWSSSCELIKGLFAGNIPIGSEASLPSQETSRSYDVCGPFMELRPNSRPEQSKHNHLFFGFYMYEYVFIPVLKILKLVFCCYSG